MGIDLAQASPMFLLAIAVAQQGGMFPTSVPLLMFQTSLFGPSFRRRVYFPTFVRTLTILLWKVLTTTVISLTHRVQSYILKPAALMVIRNSMRNYGIRTVKCFTHSV